MLDPMLLLAATDTIWTRLGVCAVCIVIGAILIQVGRHDVRTQLAEESGRRRWVNKALGRSNTYAGSKAVRLGWTRVICGIATILFGFVSIFVGPFLANGGSRPMRSSTRSPAGHLRSQREH